PAITGLITEFTTFISTILSRFAVYFSFFAVLPVKIIQMATYQGWKAKKSILRLLMRRETLFSAHPRMTVATVSFGVFAAVVPFDLAASKTLANAAELDTTAMTAKTTETLVMVPQKSISSSSEAIPTINQVVTHTVEAGDTLTALSVEYLVPVDAIAYVNNISENAMLHPGESLTIPPVEGLTHTVSDGESVASIAEKYNVSPQAIVDANLLKPPFDLFNGDVLVVPGAEVPQVVPQQAVVLASAETAEAPTGGLSLESVPGTSAGYIMPTPGKITQYSSYYHTALDIAKGCSEPIWASNNGTVVYSGWRAGGYGFMVELVHPDGRVTQYAHMSKTAVPLGASVGQGDVIGYTGATGIAYGCHLHFVVKEGGRAINPLAVM
ncbi:M23 family metallopeptidase, partial [candidate division WWE3 bacterium]|nr:M23 family metallopeptidase [candidate division WWE3 bacterium]